MICVFGASGNTGGAVASHLHVEQGMKQAGMKPSLVSVFMEMYQGASEGLVAPEAGGVVVPTPTTFETFAKQVFAPAYGA